MMPGIQCPLISQKCYGIFFHCPSAAAGVHPFQRIPDSAFQFVGIKIGFYQVIKSPSLGSFNIDLVIAAAGKQDHRGIAVPGLAFPDQVDTVLCAQTVI
jgi:hypothetical protein